MRISITNQRMMGFTLVEILLVVVIIGVMAGLAMLAIGGNESRLLQLEASRLQQRLLLAQDEAGFRQLNLGLKIDDDGYEFLQYNEQEDRWDLLQEPKLSRHQFELPVELTLELDGTPLELSPRSKDRDRDRDRDKQTSEASDQQAPAILLLADGENSPFTLTLSLKNDPEPSASAQILNSDGFSPITRSSQPGL